MPILGQQKFLVTNNPAALEQARLANLSPAGYDPTDRDRLFIHYNSKAGNIELNPTSQIYGSGRANTFGGNYSFDPSSDYLNTGWGAQSGQNPIVYGGQGLDRPNTAPQGPGGAIYGSGIRIAMPSVSDRPDTSANGYINCPTGFYQVGSACAPGVTLNPNDPNNILGINSNLTGSMGGTNGWGTGQYQDAKGVILRVITPVKTEKGKLFQIVTQVQNIGNQPGKFETKVSIPALGIPETLSNSIMVSPGQKEVLYQTLQMPTTLPENLGQIIQVKSDLYVTSLRNTNAQPILHYSNTATLPVPGTVLGNPPPTPPIPGIPLPGQGQGQNPTFPPLGPPPLPFMPPSPQPIPFPYPINNTPAIIVYPNQTEYPVGSQITMVGTGFDPGETVTVQIYSVKDGFSTTLKERLKSTTTIAGYNGTTNPVSTTVPKVGGSGGLFGLGGIFSIGGSGVDNDRFAIVMIGSNNDEKVQKILNISGNNNSSNPFISIGSGYGSGGLSIGPGGIHIG
jgi:hypothetical protein